MNAPETGEEFTVLLVIDHDDLVAPVRVNMSGASVTRGGNQYPAYPFDITLPNDEAERSPRSRLSIDNTERTIAATVMALNSAPVVDMIIVNVADPDTTVAAFEDFKLTNVLIDQGSVSGDLTLEDFTSEPWPARTMTPSNFPALHG